MLTADGSEAPVASQGSAADVVMLGLSGIRMLGAEVVGGEVEVTAETTADHVGCGGCGVLAGLHDRRAVAVRDVEAFGRPARLRWNKRRWRCPEPAASRSQEGAEGRRDDHHRAKISSDDLPPVPRRGTANRTASLRLRCAKWQFEVELGKHYGVSSDTVSIDGVRSHRPLQAHSDLTARICTQGGRSARDNEPNSRGAHEVQTQGKQPQGMWIVLSNWTVTYRNSSG